MSYKPIIEVNHLSKRYKIYSTPRDKLLELLSFGKVCRSKEFTALDDVSFVVNPGETVGIVGRNGSGKSTLLQIICGVLAQSEGSVAVNGRVAALLELGSGFNPDFTGIENVELYASILGLQPKEIAEKMASILEFSDIGDFVYQPIKTYSSGMVVRLAFATIVHMDPKILVVDEALSVGDVVFQQKCLSRIRQMQGNGTSILLVTHSTNTVIEYCDRAIFIKNGRLIADGPCRDVVKTYVDDLVEDEGGRTTPAVLDTHQKMESKSAPKGTQSARNSERSLPMEIMDVHFTDTNGGSLFSASFGDCLDVTIQLKVHKNVVLPCYGIQISSVDGIALWSATSQNIGVNLDSLQPGIHSIKWRLDLSFGAGRYIFAVGVGEIINGEYLRYHRLDCAGYVDILPQKNQGAGWLAPMPRFIVS